MGSIKVVAPILGLVLIGAGVVALAVVVPRQARGQDEEKGLATGLAIQPTAPTADAVDPVHTETATFALG